MYSLEEQIKFLDNLVVHTQTLIEEYKKYTGKSMVMPSSDGIYKEITQGWSGIPLWWDRRPLRRYCNAFPVMFKLLQYGPEHLNTGLTITQPGCHVPNHNHKTLGEYIFLHLPLIVPDGDVYFVVDGNKYTWTVGKLFAFDCRQDHESFNNTSAERVILITEFKRTVWYEALKKYMPLTPSDYEPDSDI